VGLKLDIGRVQITQTLPSKFKEDGPKLIFKYWDIKWSRSSSDSNELERCVQIFRKSRRSTNDVVSKSAK